MAFELQDNLCSRYPDAVHRNYHSALSLVRNTEAVYAAHQILMWDQQFFDPIELPSGRKLITLRDAALYITKLPKAEHDAEEWQAAMAALLLVAEHDGPTMFARIGLMRALNRHVERIFDPSRKDHHWERRKLARDQ
jgi:hypothetical protein